MVNWNWTFKKRERTRKRERERDRGLVVVLKMLVEFFITGRIVGFTDPVRLCRKTPINPVTKFDTFVVVFFYPFNELFVDWPSTVGANKRQGGRQRRARVASVLVSGFCYRGRWVHWGVGCVNKVKYRVLPTLYLSNFYKKIKISRVFGCWIHGVVVRNLPPVERKCA